MRPRRRIRDENVRQHLLVDRPASRRANQRGDVPGDVAYSAQKKLAGLEIAGKGHCYAARARCY